MIDSNIGGMYTEERGETYIIIDIRERGDTNKRTDRRAKQTRGGAKQIKINCPNDKIKDIRKENKRPCLGQIRAWSGLVKLSQFGEKIGSLLPLKTSPDPQAKQKLGHRVNFFKLGGGFFDDPAPHMPIATPPPPLPLP